MLGAHYAVISGAVRTSREESGFCPEELAMRAKVTVGFVQDVEEGKSVEWKVDLLYSLLRILRFLQLSKQARTVEGVIKRNTRARRRRNGKYDIRPGGFVPTRPRCCRRI